MKINFLLSIVFVSVVFFAFSGNYPDPELIGCTELNGSGCVCHNVEASPEVFVWVEGPDTLQQGQTGLYRMYMSGGPAIAGGYNVAVRFGVLAAVDSLSFWDYRTPFELTQAFPLPFPGITDTIYWDFAFTASGDVLMDTIYSCGLSTNWDSIPDYRDLWAFGPKYPVTIIPEVPVEFISFNAEEINNKVTLTWLTATETNNSGFIIQRSSNESEWNDLAFLSGKGNSTEINRYSFIDENPSPGNIYYRLKQIDYNGSYAFSDVVNFNSGIIAAGFELLQNYPNPFNPATKIRYNIPERGSENLLTTLTVYDLLGNEAAVLVNEEQSAGTYEVDFNAEGLSSGIYFYSLRSGNFSSTKKFVLLK